MDVVGEFEDRWNLASHDSAYITGNQNAVTIKILLRDIENGPGLIRQQHRDAYVFSGAGHLSRKV
jgi:hypothetical protein